MAQTSALLQAKGTEVSSASPSQHLQQDILPWKGPTHEFSLPPFTASLLHLPSTWSTFWACSSRHKTELLP